MHRSFKERLLFSLFLWMYPKFREDRQQGRSKISAKKFNIAAIPSIMLGPEALIYNPFDVKRA